MSDLVEKVARALRHDILAQSSGKLEELENGVLYCSDSNMVLHPRVVAQAALKAIEDAGWQCVPQQATEQMLDMGAHFYAKTECGLMDGSRDEIAALENAWDAMLSEAATPSQAGDGL